MEHPGIAALCIEFYYGSAGGKEPLAKLFPDDFSTIVPEHAVAAIMTCVSIGLSFLYPFSKNHTRYIIALTSMTVVNA